jgi:hypothetical protein
MYPVRKSLSLFTADGKRPGRPSQSPSEVQQTAKRETGQQSIKQMFFKRTKRAMKNYTSRIKYR